MNDLWPVYKEPRPRSPRCQPSNRHGDVWNGRNNQRLKKQGNAFRETIARVSLPSLIGTRSTLNGVFRVHNCRWPVCCRLKNEPTISAGDYYVELFRREFEMTETVAEIYEWEESLNAAEIARKRTPDRLAFGLINSLLIVNGSS